MNNDLFYIADVYDTAYINNPHDKDGCFPIAEYIPGLDKPADDPIRTY